MIILDILSNWLNILRRITEAALIRFNILRQEIGDDDDDDDNDDDNDDYDYE